MENQSKMKNSNSDYLKAIRKADRELELELNGDRWKQKSIQHKNKKKYNRKDSFSDLL